MAEVPFGAQAITAEVFLERRAPAAARYLGLGLISLYKLIDQGGLLPTKSAG